MRTAIIALLASTVFSMPAMASSLTVEQRAEVIKVTKTEDGTKSQALVPAERVQPGETVRFTLSWTNEMDEAAENVVLEMPVPEHMIFVVGSAENEEVETLLSVDNGATYAEFGQLDVSEGEDIRPAEAEDVTHVKWIFNTPLDAGADGEVHFDARLK